MIIIHKGVFTLNKKVLYTLSTAFLLSSLTACGANNNDQGAMGTGNNNGARPIGYYSDENINRGNGNGNAILPERDNDGPVTEILDRAAGDRNGTNRTNGRGAGNIGTRDDGFIDGNNRGTNVGTTNRGTNGGMFNGGTNVGTNNRGTHLGANYGATGTNVGNNNGALTRGGLGQYNNRNTLGDFGNNVGVNNPTRPYALTDNGMARDNRYARDDYNYHGQMADRTNNTRASYNNNYNGRLSEQISNRVEKVDNVDDVRTIVSGDNILVAIDTNDRNDRNVKQQVQNAIKNMTTGKNVRVVTDEATFTRARNIDNDLRNGGPTTDLDNDVRDMFREIGNEVDDFVRTPFRDTK
jgi:spore cortex protein